MAFSCSLVISPLRHRDVHGNTISTLTSSSAWFIASALSRTRSQFSFRHALSEIHGMASKPSLSPAELLSRLPRLMISPARLGQTFGVAALGPSANWVGSVPCRTGAHCTACRGSERFRQTIVNAGLEAERDFPCPWNGKPPSDVFRMLIRRKGCRPCAPIIIYGTPVK